jgi:DNA polymerase III delta prime subunit
MKTNLNEHQSTPRVTQTDIRTLLDAGPMLTTNYLHDIPKEVQVRCYCINRNAGPVKNYETALAKISKAEFNCALPKSVIKKYASIGEGSWRKKMTMLNIACNSHRTSSTGIAAMIVPVKIKARGVK